MDKYILVCVLLLLFVEVSCVVCLFSAGWLVSDNGVAGTIRHGLSLYCQSTPGKEELCIFQHLHATWSTCSLLIVLALLVNGISISLFAVSLKRMIPSFTTAGKWCALIGMMFLCTVGIIFPFGFSADIFGGKSFLLVETFQIGYSYILFILSILVGIFALCSANRFFLPYFQIFRNR